MDFSSDKQNLSGAVEDLDVTWSLQSNGADDKTKFIYRIDSYLELLQCDQMRALSPDGQQYAKHRWYNNKTSEVCERIFVEYGARKATWEENVMQHTDVFIADIPFDIKLSVFPDNHKVKDMRLNLILQEDRNRLIRWFYLNQSTEQRNCFNNRIFVVCKGTDTLNNYYLKQSFDQMDVKIKAYMDYLSQIDYTVNEVVVSDKQGQKRKVKADVIVINNDNQDIKQRLEIERCPKCNGRYQLMVARLGKYRGNIIKKCPNCIGYENV